MHLLLFLTRPLAMPSAADPPADLPGRIPFAAYLPDPDTGLPWLAADGERVWFLKGEPGEASVWSVHVAAPDTPVPLAGPTAPVWAISTTGVASRLLVWSGPDRQHLTVLAYPTGPGEPVPIADAAQDEHYAGLVPGEPELALVTTAAGRRSHLRSVNVRTGEDQTLWTGPTHTGFLFDDTTGTLEGAWDTHPWGLRLWRVQGGKQHHAADVGNFWGVPPRLLRSGVHAGEAYLQAQADGDEMASIYAVDLATGRRRTVEAGRSADITAVLTGRLDPRPLAVAEYQERNVWRALDPSVAPDFEWLTAQLDGDVSVDAISSDGDTWLIEDEAPTHWTWWYVYRRSARRLVRVPPHYPTGDLVRWRPVLPFTVTARDGLPLVSYLTLPDPARFGEAPYPVVVDVHGGPRARNGWNLDPTAQRLADAGFAVLQVNFRGSTGFGQAFADADQGQWGRATQTDLVDALAEAARRGLVDPERAAIEGASFGGYAALVGATTQPGQWRSASAGAALGHPRGAWWTGSGRGVAPDRGVDALDVPLLVWHGGRDHTVPFRVVAPFVRRAERLGKPMTLIRLPTEGHGASGANWAALMRIQEAFLGECLGVATAPVDRRALEGAVVTVPWGADRIPGLAEALTAP